MVQSRKSPLASLSAAQESDLRSFYVELMERRQRDGWAVVEQTLAQIATELKGQQQQPSKRRKHQAPTSVPLTFVVSKTGPHERRVQHLGREISLCGRLNECSIIVGHEQHDGALVENLEISRVQFILLRVVSELVVVDCWSVAGTRTISRSKEGALQESRPGRRQTLLFAVDETFTLEVGADARITFNPPDDPILPEPQHSAPVAGVAAEAHERVAPDTR